MSKALQVAKKMVDLIEHAPAGGILHDATITPEGGPAGGSFGLYLDIAVFTIHLGEAQYAVTIKREA